MPRLLLLTPDFPPRRGGVARYLDAFASFFRDSITVVAAPEIGSEAFDASCGYRVVRTQLVVKWFWPRWIPMFAELVRRSDEYDIAVVSHVLPSGTAAWIASHFTKRPYVVIVHGLDVGLAKRHPWKRLLAGVVLRDAKGVIANSKALERDVRESFRVERTVVSYPPLRTNGWLGVGTPPGGPQRSEDTTGGETPRQDPFGLRLLTVSRLVRRKGHLRILAALKLLRDSGRGEAVSGYRIVGAGDMEGAMRETIDEFGLSDLVTFMREVSDDELGQLYEWADLFVMPTSANGADREGFGMVYLEAASYGVPSLASNLPGVDEAVIDGDTGVLVSDGDVNALAGTIFRLHADRTELSRLGANARERAARDFTVEKSFGPLLKLL
ncbi:hypothetical protein A2856_02275 [Candidatus Uhrbacteria bacterium RIFCSPHIGHO2_01_FULL_63_20]|uniref:Glycosyltransferase subfamily 4-like N-terminal domain-containing protein n=1 Tax=Candidatus Uhrbacteria bacterium RIFCSPHIGHO2_01_FULL_63_20 TaxID=1802385 RepID=A0A1F7TKI3_9BACT|nr:MAG: hypothetical protein A2856_02275 [Candidatus Uhrbacteria bacterium RIFCSPHIGHO2_01_FULL_63_20]